MIDAAFFVLLAANIVCALCNALVGWKRLAVWNAVTAGVMLFVLIIT